MSTTTTWWDQPLTAAGRTAPMSSSSTATLCLHLADLCSTGASPAAAMTTLAPSYPPRARQALQHAATLCQDATALPEAMQRAHLLTGPATTHLSEHLSLGTPAQALRIVGEHLHRAHTLAVAYRRAALAPLLSMTSSLMMIALTLGVSLPALHTPSALRSALTWIGLAAGAMSALCMVVTLVRPELVVTLLSARRARTTPRQGIAAQLTEATWALSVAARLRAGATPARAFREASTHIRAMNLPASPSWTTPTAPRDTTQALPDAASHDLRAAVVTGAAGADLPGALERHAARAQAQAARRCAAITSWAPTIATVVGAAMLSVTALAALLPT